MYVGQAEANVAKVLHRSIQEQNRMMPGFLCVEEDALLTVFPAPMCTGFQSVSVCVSLTFRNVQA